MSEKLEALLARILSDNIKVVSFDIFDTLITRKTALPTGIFLQVQKKENLEAGFCEMRINAENDARMYAKQCKDARLYQKYIICN